MDEMTYRELFAVPRMAEDLMRLMGKGDLIDRVDFGTLIRLPDNCLGIGGKDSLKPGDAIWRARMGDDFLYALILLDFAPGGDRRNALRGLTCMMHLYDQMYFQSPVELPEQMPTVLPVVLYAGEGPWQATVDLPDLMHPLQMQQWWMQEIDRDNPWLLHMRLFDGCGTALSDIPPGNLMRAVVGLEQSASPEDVAAAVEELRERLRESGDTELGRIFWDAATRAAGAMQPAGVALPDLQGTFAESSPGLLESLRARGDGGGSEGARQ